MIVSAKGVCRVTLSASPSESGALALSSAARSAARVGGEIAQTSFGGGEGCGEQGGPHSAGSARWFHAKHTLSHTSAEGSKVRYDQSAEKAPLAR